MQEHTQNVPPTIFPCDSSSSSSSSENLYSPEAPPYSPCDEFSSVSYSSASVSDDRDDHSDIEQPSQQFISDQPTPEQPPTEDTFFSFKIVGDNIDKNVKPSRQRAEIKAQSLHYFYSYAVRDRVSVSELSDACPKTHPDPRKLLPSQEDIESICKDICILISSLVLKKIITT